MKKTGRTSGNAVMVILAAMVSLCAADIFVPGNNLPISPFFTCDNEDRFLRLYVTPCVLAATGYSFSIAKKAAGPMEYIPQSRCVVDSVSGLITLANPGYGSFVTVTSKALNSFPVVTHWKKSLYGGRGGFLVGATDGIDTLYYDENSANVKKVFRILNQSSSQEHYDVSKYALYGPDKTKPSYEVYAGETFSTTAVGDLAAIYLSNSVVKYTGFPVVFKNHPAWLYSNAPFFQIINSIIVNATPSKQSLITIVLPPFWKKTNQYPIVFTAFYDINDNVYDANERGFHMCEILHETSIVHAGKTGIGIFWNGCGALSTYSLSRSAYENLSRIFDLAAENLGGDRNRVVAFGSSRGGLTAIAAAGNPYYSNYKIQYVIADYAPKKVGDMLYKTSFQTCFSIVNTFTNMTNNRFSWQPDWKDADNIPGRELFAYNLLGVDLRPVAYHNRSDSLNQRTHFSDTCMSMLRKNGTSLILYTNTHDAYQLFSNEIDFVNKARGYGIPVEQNIALRAGHNPVVYSFTRVGAALSAMVENQTMPLNNCLWYRQETGNSGRYLPFSPAQAPFFFEGTRYACIGREASFVVAGQGGYDFRLGIYKIDDSLFADSLKISVVGCRYAILDGRLPLKTCSQLSYASINTTVQPYMATGNYLYSFQYKKPDSSTWITVDGRNISRPDFARSALVEIRPDTLGWMDANSFLNLYDPLHLNTSWGLSEY